MKALGFQPVESTSLSKFWFQIVNLHPYNVVGADAGFMNSGGVRAKKTYTDGTITVRRCRLNTSG